MDNASLILTTVDRHLDHPVRLVLYGRAAIYFGFQDAPDDVAHSKDIDAIIPLSELSALTNDLTFWDATEATNAELKERGLYITHLFQADQVFLRRNWEADVLPVEGPSLRWLRLFRPATLDLILTKMMRGDDPQDMADVAFMVRHDRITPEQIEEAFVAAIIPDIQELRDAFERAQPRVREIVREA